MNRAVFEGTASISSSAAQDAAMTFFAYVGGALQRAVIGVESASRDELCEVIYWAGLLWNGV